MNCFRSNFWFELAIESEFLLLTTISILYSPYLGNVDQKLNQLKNALLHPHSPIVTACRVCFQEVEGSSQCGMNRNACSGWSTHSSWSPPFRDDTDSRGGRCIY